MTGGLTGTSAVVDVLRQDLERLYAKAKNPNLRTAERRSIEVNLRKIIEELGQFLNDIDPVRQPTSVFDPGNPKVVGRFVALALVAQDRHPLSKISRFYGSGVYAIYYSGEFPLYAALARSETPLYVGQAAPAINNARTPIDQGDRLCRRLDEHRKNILKAVETLDISDFQVRSLVVQSGWETASEDYLIHLFRPIWNSETNILFGLGKHGDAAKTRANRRSPWDTVHPGRVWAADGRLVDAKSPDAIANEIAAHFEKHPVFVDMDSLLSSFIEELRQI